MKLREEILKEHSKAQCNKIVDWVGTSQKRFDELFSLFLNDEYRVVQRSAWPVSYCVEKHPSFISSHLKNLLYKIKEPGMHEAVKRNGTRLLQHIAIPEEYEGEIMDMCFEYLALPQSTIATKVFSLKALGKLALKYPEIIPEIQVIIDEQMPYATQGFKSAVKEFSTLIKKCR